MMSDDDFSERVIAEAQERFLRHAAPGASLQVRMPTSDDPDAVVTLTWAKQRGFFMPGGTRAIIRRGDHRTRDDLEAAIYQAAEQLGHDAA